MCAQVFDEIYKDGTFDLKFHTAKGEKVVEDAPDSRIDPTFLLTSVRNPVYLRSVGGRKASGRVPDNGRASICCCTAH